MAAIYLASPRSFAGKSLLTLALGKDAQRRGKRVKYFKPIGPYPTIINGVPTDQDALAIARALGVDTPPAELCSVLLTPDFHRQVLAGVITDLLPTISQAYQRVAVGADLMLIGGMGSLFSTGLAYGLPSWKIADATKAKVVVMARYEPERTVDEMLAVQHTLGARFAGVVINAVPIQLRQQVTDDVAPYLERHDIPLFGVLPEDPILHAIPIRDLIEELNARVLTGDQYLDELVEHFAIGAMNEEAALSHFRKITHKAVVTGGDRSDIQRAALETSTRALVLTGGIYPTNIILSTALERKVPVLLVNEDTLTTIERIEGMLGHLRIRQPRKIERAEMLVREHVDLDRLWGAVGL